MVRAALGFVFLAWFSFSWAASKPKLDRVVRLPGSLTVANARVGGISGIAFFDGALHAVSDDRGKFGPPRIFQFKKGLQSLEVEKVIPLQGLRDFFKTKTVLDLEGLAVSGDSLLVTSEADLSRSPREKNRLLLVSGVGQIRGEVPLPAEVQAEPTGTQTQGAHNNLGPEGLSVSPSGNVLWVGFESALLQDQNKKEEKKNLRMVPFYRYQKHESGWEFSAKMSYPLEPRSLEQGEIFRGVSEVLAMGDDELLVIERSANLGTKGLRYGGGLYKWSCKTLPCSKKTILDFYQDLEPEFGPQQIPNFEGMTFTDDTKSTLLLVSDNNLDKNTETIFVFLKMPED